MKIIHQIWYSSELWNYSNLKIPHYFALVSFVYFNFFFNVNIILLELGDFFLLSLTQFILNHLWLFLISGLGCSIKLQSEF